MCQNNLSYYLKLRGDAADKDEAQTLASAVIERKNRYPEKAGIWQDTYHEVVEKDWNTSIK